MTQALARLAFSGLLTIAAAGCATMPGEPVAATQAGQNEALHALFARADEAYLVRNPVAALYRGDVRYADRLGNSFALASFAAERAAAEDNLAALRGFDRGALSPTDQIAYDVFEYYQEEVLAQTSPAILRFEAGLPVDHFRGFHINYPRLASAGGIAPFTTVRDYENNLKRHGDAVRNIDEAIARMRAGMADGVVHPRLTVELMIAQLDTQLVLATEQSPYWTPITSFPKDFSPADRSRLTAAHRTAIEQQLRPALQRFRTFLATDYLPASRTSVGLSDIAGGPDYYRHLVAQTTTLPLDPEAIHRIGLAEVARINAALAQARAEAGNRKPTVYRDKATLTEAWYAIARKVDPKLDMLFAREPRTKLEIRPYEAFREKFNLAASYNSGKPDGSRPGVFYFSGYDLANREVSPTVALYLHEGSPGHHFQNMIAAENEALPAFMRFGGNVAYGEGWGLYAESLGTKWACTTIRWSGSARWAAARCCARCGWWSIRGCTPRAGAASRRSTIWSPTASRVISRRARSRATSSCRGRRWATRSASSRSRSCASARKMRWATASTSRHSTTRCSTPDRCRWRCWKRRSTRGSPASEAKVVHPGPDRAGGEEPRRGRCGAGRRRPSVRKGADHSRNAVGPSELRETAEWRRFIATVAGMSRFFRWLSP